ncbi:LytTR family transcriptional regulator DNA-binding domain-containing protein [Paenibacillus sp. TC-CSREp1]|uniref:LytTR family transcriptional regulator DNA-binding domain-containing protein n=1 Tax=Paenibacillus sp. TC-CSREp1 TaxID=3410089 RepID=UPI003CFF91AF
MHFQSVYHGEQLFLPNFEFNMQCNQVLGIITDLKRKEILISQLQNHSLYYIFRAQQNEYLHLTVEELITFLINVTERRDVHSTALLEYFSLKEICNVRVKNLTPSKRTYVTLLRVYFAHQPTLVLEEPFFYLEEEDRRQFKRIIEDLSKEKHILVITSNLEDALISCSVIYRLNELGFQQLDIKDSEEDRQDTTDQGSNITLQKIHTKKDGKLILFNPPEIDFIESIDGAVIVHVDGENYHCTLTLAELEQRLANFGFFRCHRSYIVNLQKVREIITWTKNSYSLRLHTGKDNVVPLSRTKLQDLKILLNL